MRGGLGLTVVIVGTLLAATTGVVAATIIVMGMLMLPTMLKYGYDKRFATFDRLFWHTGADDSTQPGARAPE